MIQKLKYILILLLFWSTGTFAQKIDRELIKIRQSIREDELFEKNNRVIGSPYTTDVALESEVYLKNKTIPKKANLKYNAYTDNFEIIRNGMNYVFISISQVDSIKYNGYIFIHSPYRDIKRGLFKRSVEKKEGFMARLVKGPCSIYKVFSIEFKEAQKAKTGYDQSKPARFERKSPTYYIKFQDDVYPREIESIRKNKFLDNFESMEEELRAYLKEKDLNLKNEGDLVKLVRYYNQHLQ